MRIVHLNFGMETGGTETMLVDILNEQCQFAELHVVVVNNTYHPDLLARIDRRVCIHLIERPVGSRNPAYLLRLNRLLWRLRPDVIHGHNPKVITLLRQSCRKFLTVHDVNVPATYFRHYYRLFAISNIVQADIRERSGLHAEVVYNGVPVHMIRPKEEPSATASAFDGQFRLVQISRLMHLKKGQHILLQALRRLVTDYRLTNLRLDFIGEGPSQPELVQLMTDLRLQPYVRFLGLKDRAYIYHELARYDLLVQPSLYEGFGLTVAEAMVAGVPVLVSDTDGPRELINDNEFGTSFSTGNAADCARRIYEILLMHDTKAFQDRLNRTRAWASQTFDVRRTARQYLDAYSATVHSTSHSLFNRAA